MSTVEMVWQPNDGPVETVTVLNVSAVMEAAIAAAVEARQGSPEGDAVLQLPQVVAGSSPEPRAAIFRAWRVLSFRVVGP